jgi:hypothetical protein
MLSTTKRIATAGAAGSAIALVAVVLGSGASGASAAPPQSQDAHMRDLARAAAHRGGDDSPTSIRWVHTNRGASQRQTAGADVGEDSARDVYVIEMHGNFVATYARTPDGTQPHGTVMTVTFDAASDTVTDFGLTDVDSDLASLGTVHEVG